MDNKTNNSVTTEVGVNTTNCTQPDAYDISIVIEWFEKWILWEGGIAFNAVYWLIILIISFAGLNILRRIYKWKFLSARFVGGHPAASNINVNRTSSSWADWLSLKIDEEAVGKDGATFLWFQYRLIQVEVLRMALGIILIVMHLHGDKLGESPNKTLRSTGLYNIGVNGTHGVFCCAILITLAWLMKEHGHDRSIKSLASHAVNSFSSICNRKWLMISGLGENTTSDSLFEYLKSQFDLKGIGRNGIVLALNISELLPVVDQLNEIRNIQQHLSKPETIIQRRWWEFWVSPSSEIVDTVMYGPEWIQSGDDARRNQEIDATIHYKRKEEILSVKLESIQNNLEFIGTVFICFDSQADAKAAKIAIRNYQTQLFWKNEKEEDHQDFRPSQWTVQYAPLDSDIDWIHLKKPRPAWKTWALLLRLAVTYSIYVILMAAPGTLIRWLHLYGEGADRGSIFWNRFVLPTIVSFFTTKLTDWVTRQDQHRRHSTVTQLCLSSLRSICYLNIILYLIRMLAMKPLPLLLAGQLHSEDFRLACLFFPVHGSFVACCIIVNTASGILTNHLRLDFIFSYIAKWFTCRSEAELTSFKESYRIDYDFATNYAELTSNFALTSFFIMIFPVISLVSCVFSILRFFSDRAIMTDMYAISQAGHHLHQESINMALRFAVASPLALLIYRRIQLGPTSPLLDPGIAAPLCLLILYVLYLLYSRVKLDGFIPNWFRQLLKLRSNEILIEDDDVESADSMSNNQHEYNPLAKIRAAELLKAMNV